MPGTDHQNPLDRRRRIRLLPGAARGRRQGAGRGAGLRGARRRCGHPRARRGIRRPRLHRGGARSVLADRAGPARPRRQAHPGAFAAAAGEDQDRRARPGRHAGASQARCRSSTAAPRRWASATAGPTRSSGRSGSATPPASPATARRCWTTSSELDGVTEPVCIIWGDQDHRAPPEVLDAYRPVPSRMKNVEVHIFPGILHGYMMPGSPEGVRPEDARFLDAAGACDPRRPARRRRDAAQGVVVPAAQR